MTTSRVCTRCAMESDGDAVACIHADWEHRINDLEVEVAALRNLLENLRDQVFTLETGENPYA